MDITVVMTYFNRKPQLLRTLDSIRRDNPTVQVIVVDDGSTDGEEITFLDDEYTRIIILKDKTWMNPCIAFNTGFREVLSDAVILQNSECLHMGNIVGHAITNLQLGVYLNYAAYSLNRELTNRLPEGIDILKPLNLSPNKWGENGWYNHPVYNDTKAHFCSAIMREDLYDLGGFDERFANGLGFDDNEFIERITYKKMMNIISVTDPFVIHQYHNHSFTNVNKGMEINYELLAKFRKTLGHDMKQFNQIYTDDGLDTGE